METETTLSPPNKSTLETLRTGLMGRTATAAKLRVDKKTLDRWRKNRVGPPWIELAGKIFYRDEALIKWLLEQERLSLAPQTNLPVRRRRRRRLRILQGETVD